MEEQVLILDPSELYRPEQKDKSLFRQYTLDKDDHIQTRVRDTYLKMHSNQTVQFAQEKMALWCRFDHASLTVMEALSKLNALVDESDPDVDVPNIVHAFQTAERLREKYPDQAWLHLTGLIHDLGKVMALYGEPQWAVVGDTFPLGCAFADSIVYRSTTFQDNPDLHNQKFRSRLGIYSENCGLDNVQMSWGHDEYMYRVLKNHSNMRLPEEALFIIRFHSFYPWHTAGDYNYLCDNKDLTMLKWVQEFNQFDLYTKSDDLPDVEALMPYYQDLIDRYIPGKVKF